MGIQPDPFAWPGQESGELADEAGVLFAIQMLQHGRPAGFPLLLLIAGAAFLLLQHRIDRRDPKLARPPLTADTGLPFRPPPEA